MTFYIILGIVWIVCAVFNLWFIWNDEKDQARRDGYISVTASDLLMGLLSVILAPIVACAFFKVMIDENETIIRIPIKRRK